MTETYFEFARQRDFGDVVGDGLRFIITNFKALITGFLMYVGPFILISVFMQRGFLEAFLFDPGAGLIPMQFTSNLIIYLLVLIAASVMLMTMTYSVVMKYQDNPEESILDGLWPYMTRNLGRILVAGLALVGISVVLIMAFFAFTSIGGGLMFAVAFLVFIPFMIYLWVPLSIMPFIYLVEDVDLGSAISRAFYLVRNKWWQTFAVFFVIALVAIVLSWVFSIPSTIYSVSRSFSMGTDFSNFSFGPMYYALNTLSTLGSMFVAIYQLIGVTLQYYSLRELKDGTGLMERIEQIDQDDME